MSGRGSAAVVLMYHRITTPEYDPFWVKVGPEHFSQHLDAIREVADVVPLRSVRDRDAGRRVAITLDDGYRDNLDVALPMLTAASAPATVFVASDVLSGQGFRWNRLEHLILDTSSRRSVLDIEAGGRCIRVNIGTTAGKRRALLVAGRLVRVLPPAESVRVIERVADQLGEPNTSPRSVPLLDAAALDQLARNGLVEIGGHTRSHTMLSALDPDEQWQEIAGGKQALEQVIGTPVTSFAYPYGYPGSFDRRTPGLVRKAGFELACTTVRGKVGRWTNRYRIPRLAVWDWDRPEFLRQLQRAFDGLE